MTSALFDRNKRSNNVIYFCLNINIAFKSQPTGHKKSIKDEKNLSELKQ